MKTLSQALEQLLGQAQADGLPAHEQVSLAAGLGRFLAEDICSPIDVPAYDNSQMDGYAGIAVEMNNALAPLPISQRIPAGHPGQPLKEGSVARIFTGAPIPSGANAVIMQEQVELLEDGKALKCLAPVRPGQNIRPAGGDLRQGQVVLQKGRCLSAADLGLSASVGLTELAVYRPLRVAVFSSGDELRQPGESLGFGQIYDSNRPMILHLVRGMGFEARDMGCLPDRLDATRQALAQASAENEVILTCGGVSVGEEDHIKAAISAEGKLELWKISIKPGKPFAFGRVGQATFLGMPGNPVAAWVTFNLLIRPYLQKRAGGEATRAKGLWIHAGFDWPRPDPRQEFLRGWIDEDGLVQIHDRQNSSVLSSVTECNGLVEIPEGTSVAKVDRLRFIPYSELLS
jgi:molybdopterin molybdotransferase